MDRTGFNVKFFRSYWETMAGSTSMYLQLFKAQYLMISNNNKEFFKSLTLWFDVLPKITTWQAKLKLKTFEQRQ